MTGFSGITSNSNKGTTLVELLMAITIFGILMSFMFPTFSFINNRIAYFNDMQMMNDRGKRSLEYIVEDVKQAGFIIGSLANIPYCTAVVPSSSNVIVHTDSNFAGSANPFDQLTFLTAVPVPLNFNNQDCIDNQADCGAPPTLPNENKNYTLNTCNADSGDSIIPVDSVAGCISSSSIFASTGLNGNGRSLITFESIAPTIVGVEAEDTRVYYTVSQYTGNNITITPNLIQQVPDFSNVYGVRQFSYTVDASRSLIKTEWEADCTPTASVLDDAFGNANIMGGINALQFEYIYQDDSRPVGQQLRTSDLPPSDITNLKSIRIWMLLKAETPDKDYTNDEEYILHSFAGVGDPDYDLQGDANNLVEFTSGKDNLFNDNFRRTILSKTVEVKNFAIKK